MFTTIIPQNVGLVLQEILGEILLLRVALQETRTINVNILNLGSGGNLRRKLKNYEKCLNVRS